MYGRASHLAPPDDVGRGRRRAGARTLPRLIRASRSASVNSPFQLAASFVTPTATSFGATFWMSAAGTDAGASFHETFLRPVQSTRCGNAARRTRGRGRAGRVGRVCAELLRVELDRLVLAPPSDRCSHGDRAQRGNIIRDLAEPRDEVLVTWRAHQRRGRPPDRVAAGAHTLTRSHGSWASGCTSSACTSSQEDASDVACCTIWVRFLLPEAITAGSRARRHSGTRARAAAQVWGAAAAPEVPPRHLRCRHHTERKLAGHVDSPSRAQIAPPRWLHTPVGVPWR